MGDQETDRIGGNGLSIIASLERGALELFRFWNSISSWGGAGSSLSTSSGSKERVIGADFRSLLYGRSSYQECVGEAREDGLDREAMPMPLLYRPSFEAKETRVRHRTCSIPPSLVISIRFSYSLVHCAN